MILPDEKYEMRYWLLTIGILLVILGNGAFIPITAGIGLIGLGGYQIYQAIKIKKSS